MLTNVSRAVCVIVIGVPFTVTVSPEVVLIVTVVGCKETEVTV